MRKDLNLFIEEEKKLINSKSIKESDIKNHLIKIKFFQHERLIHLIVTMFTGLFAILFFLAFIIINNIYLLILSIILILLFFPYIIHYFYLENGVQELYKEYDLLVKKTN